MFQASSSNWMQDSSTLKVLITRATYPSQAEPNYALNLEVAEHVNQKKANTPREAAMTIAQLVNHRNPHVAMLALALLETLVQNCGYPFQLQIATKEFLNELVRRFPERPPPYPGPVMSRILELIHTWKETICVESRWKDDFGNVRDMHRLLTFKGYRFRDTPRTQQASNIAASNLKTAEELENEDREAQSAKLQELIRRGTPRDLAQAQELMKSLAGANPDAKPDYRTQALNELNKFESKVILLNEMLDNVDVSRGERFVRGDVYDQVASVLTNARPKIQGWISNAETDDPESLDTFLQINDQINTVLNRYEAFKKGDYAAAANPIPAELSRPQNDLSLIDLDESTPSNTGATAPGTTANQIDELTSLFGPSSSNTTPAPQPQFSAGFGTIPLVQPQQAQSQLAGFGQVNAPYPNYASHPGTSFPQSQLQSGQSTNTSLPGSIRLGTPQQVQAAAPPNYFNTGVTGMNGQNGPSAVSGMTGNNSLFGMGMGGAPIAPQPSHSQQPQQSQQQPQNSSSQTQGKDPFADLVGLF